MIEWIVSQSALMKTMLLIVSILLFATIISGVMNRLRPAKVWKDVMVRVRSWWVMAAVFMTAMVLQHKAVSLVLFCFLSCMAMREYLKLIDIPAAYRRLIPWSFIIIILQYYWIMIDWYGMFLIFIPIYAFLFLSIRLILTQQPSHFLDTTAKVQWGLLAFGLGFSHVAYLLNIPVVAKSQVGGQTLLLFLVLLTEMNDVFQYIWGKLLGRRKIVPVISPNKTWGGFLGGLATTGLIGPALIFLTPFKKYWEAMVLASVIAVAGFFGDVVMSALKRDRGIKDFGAVLPGHGGVLDRIDSMCFTAPIFFHIVRYWYV